MNKNSRGLAKYKTAPGFAPILIVVILGAISVVGYFILKPLLTPALLPPPSSPTPESTPKQTGQIVRGGCKVTGCEGEICADESFTFQLTCAIVIPADSCYLNATCERQEDGECGWTQTEELKNCIYGDTDPNDAQRKADLQILRQVLEQYKLEGNNVYPTSLQTLISENYLKEMPYDPVTGESYTYQVSANRLDYTITATLEDGSLYKASPP